MQGAPTELPSRVLIFGNSGAGKSTLAQKLARERELAHLDLDPLAWRPTDPPTRVPIAEAVEPIRAFIAQQDRWVVEGCYADLLELLLEEATELIFLDLPVARCQEHARARPFEAHKYESKAAQDANLPMLLDFIAGYPDREGPLGRPAHEMLFESFVGRKQRLTEVDAG